MILYLVWSSGYEERYLKFMSEDWKLAREYVERGGKELDSPTVEVWDLKTSNTEPIRVLNPTQMLKWVLPLHPEGD